MDPATVSAAAVLLGALLAVIRFLEGRRRPRVSKTTIQLHDHDGLAGWLRATLYNRGRKRQIEGVRVIVGWDRMPGVIDRFRRAFTFARKKSGSRRIQRARDLMADEFTGERLVLRAETIPRIRKSVPPSLEADEAYVFEADLGGVLDRAEKMAAGSGKTWTPLEKMSKICVMFVDGEGNRYVADLAKSSRRDLQKWVDSPSRRSLRPDLPSF